ncbi:hypothetical protein [Parabacteroides distasonis]|uniref:hypothetical protein n=1 Tax=Parabacteroides distasonis TaxID=823 RepID=UPI00189C9F92|nr:hypothetical protein [Parabacteroides distasonis]MDB9154179.1 hypothetical protein [Parabacteroides distasonis]MDB9158760.1 hypothetical protein [Parabacteroides distasonis]MDB9167484.1 hypothetical protein [Parabacteroides distasonis]MDB9171994.1 hypothetical protein [Parabacteroides distasonis]MDB9195363.1 hypothetical protein [Parabacteroides distasonis]
MEDRDIDLNVDDIKIGNETTPLIEAGADEVIPEDTTPTTAIDEDDIKIGDKKAPIVMLFGPPTSGKSMTLVRLARYLRKLGYTVKADTTFKSDDTYKERCDKFHKNLNSKEALDGNALNEFLMVKIINHGTTVCQILEAPGEHYFNPKKPDEISARNFRPYLTQIIRNLPNRKIWVYITEAEWNVHASVKDSYVGRIRNCKHQLLRNSDRVIILYNKVDQKEELFENGHLHISSAEKAMKDEYEGLSIVFKNPNPITSLWRPNNYRFVPFCTGYYTKQVGGKPKYNESEEMYPKLLWGQLVKCIKG